MTTGILDSRILCGIYERDDPVFYRPHDNWRNLVTRKEIPVDILDQLEKINVIEADDIPF